MRIWLVAFFILASCHRERDRPDDDPVQTDADPAPSDDDPAPGDVEPAPTNSAPRIDSIVIAPAAITNDGTLNCTVVADDPDGDATTVTYTWTNVTRTDAELGTASTLVLTPTTAAPGDEITCTAVASDGELSTTASASANIDNRAPVVDVAVTPAATISATLTCAESAVDPDGEPVTTTYAWTRNGAALADSATVVLTPDTAKLGDVFACTATTSDGALSASGSASTTVALSAGCASLGTRVDHLDATVQTVRNFGPFAVGEVVSVTAVADNPPAMTYVQASWYTPPTGQTIIASSGRYSASGSRAVPEAVDSLIVRLQGEFVSGATEWTITYTCGAPP